MILPTRCTICVLEPMAMLLPMALPPTVKPATKADIPKEISWGMEKSKFERICATMAADALPDITPQMSPITSQQTLLTLSAFRKSRIDHNAVFEPAGIFCRQDRTLGGKLRRFTAAEYLIHNFASPVK